MSFILSGRGNKFSNTILIKQWAGGWILSRIWLNGHYHGLKLTCPGEIWWVRTRPASGDLWIEQTQGTPEAITIIPESILDWLYNYLEQRKMEKMK